MKTARIRSYSGAERFGFKRQLPRTVSTPHRRMVAHTIEVERRSIARDRELDKRALGRDEDLVSMVEKLQGLLDRVVSIVELVNDHIVGAW
jgi:hypothetical protein